MRRRLHLISAAVLALFAVQCDPKGFGLFPDYLTNITNSYNLSSVLPGASGVKYFLNVIQAYPEFIYVVRVLPDGSRRFALLNGALDLVGAYDEAAAGGLYGRISDNTHACGACIVTIEATGALTIGVSDFSSPADFRDYRLVNFSGSAYGVFGSTSYNGSNTVIEYYSAGVSPGGISLFSEPLTIGDSCGDFALEGASPPGSYSSGPWVVLRDRATGQGYASILSGAPSSQLYFYSFFPIGTIVPGSVRFSHDGRPVVERLNGRLSRINSYGSENEGTDEVDLHDYLVGYGVNDAMYLFKPSSGQIVKTLAWWRDD